MFKTCRLRLGKFASTWVISGSSWSGHATVTGYRCHQQIYQYQRPIDMQLQLIMGSRFPSPSAVVIFKQDGPLFFLGLPQDPETMTSSTLPHVNLVMTEHPKPNGMAQTLDRIIHQLEKDWLRENLCHQLHQPSQPAKPAKSSHPTYQPQHMPCSLLFPA